MKPHVTLRAALGLLTLLLLGDAALAQPSDTVWLRGGQNDGSNEANWSPDGATFAIAGEDGTVKVFDGATNFLLQTIHPGLAPSAELVAYTPDGARLGVGLEGPHVGVWDIASGAPVWTASLSSWAYGVNFSPDGALFVHGVGTTLQVRDADTGALLQSIPQGGPTVHDTAFSPDGQLLAVSTSSTPIKVWRVSDWTLARTITGAPEQPYLAFSPDGTVLVGAGLDGTQQLKAWNVATGQFIRSFSFGNSFIEAVYPGFSPDGQLVFAGHRYNGVKIFNFSTGALVRAVPDVQAIRLAPDGQTFLGQPVLCGETSRYRWAILSFPEGQLLDEFMPHASVVANVAASNDGTSVASGARYIDSAVRVWDAGTGQRTEEYFYTCNSDGVDEVVFSPDDALVAAGGADWDGQVRVWNRATGQLAHEISFGAGSYLEGLDFSPDGTRLAAGDGDGFVYIVAFPAGVVLRQVNTGPVLDLAYAPGGALVAVATTTNIRLVDPATGVVVRTLASAAERVRFTADGTQFVSAGLDGVVRVWNVADGTPVRTITGYPGQILALALSPDDRYVFTGGTAPAQLRDFATGVLVTTYSDETAPMSDADFVSGGSGIAYARPDGSVGVAQNPAAQAPVAVSAAPVGGPVVIGAGGGSFQFTVTLANTTDQPQTFDAWTAVTGPVDREPVLGPLTATLPAGGSVTRTITQAVPAAAPAGTYSYAVNVGTFPDAVAASASFPVVKEGGALAVRAGGVSAPEADSWAVGGWDEAVGSASAALTVAFALSEASPNPARGATRLTLTLALPAAEHVTVAVFDALGRRVATLHDGPLAAGPHRLVLDGSALPPGVYVVRAAGATARATQRVTLLR